VEGPGAEVALTIRIDSEVTAVEAVAVEIDEPTASRAKFRTAARVLRLHAVET
jgi:hypothetical protein